MFQALKNETFENFATLIQKVLPRISYCCSSEFLQLMQLPAVKIVSPTFLRFKKEFYYPCSADYTQPCDVQGRAKQLYNAGYKSLEDVVNATPKALVSAVDHLSFRVAYEIIAAAKVG